MPKKREKNSDEYYRGLIREQAKEIRHLQKRVKELEKYQFPQDEEPIKDTEDTFVELPRFQGCPDCGKGVLEEFEIAGKVIGTCNVCSYRKRVR